MEEQFKFKKQFSNILIIVIAASILITVATILISKPGASRIWANVLLNNQYFMGLSLGAAFFLAVHRVALSGWHYSDTKDSRFNDVFSTGRIYTYAPYLFWNA